MPRIESLNKESKFKKRRAWLTEDLAPLKNQPPENTPESNISKTRVKHDYSKSVTRVEHDYNMNETRVKHEYNTENGLKPEVNHDKQLDCNMSITRVKHEYNKSVTRLEHVLNVIKTKNDLISSFDSSNINHKILTLSDVQKQIFWLLALECFSKQNNKTGPIEIKAFFSDLKASTPVIRTTLNRMFDKKLLQKEPGKLGKNGFCIISFPPSIWNAVETILREAKLAA